MLAGNRWIKNTEVTEAGRNCVKNVWEPCLLFSELRQLEVNPVPENLTVLDVSRLENLYDSYHHEYYSSQMKEFWVRSRVLKIHIIYIII